MCKYMFVYIYTHVCVCVCVGKVCMYVHVCMYAYMHMCASECYEKTHITCIRIYQYVYTPCTCARKNAFIHIPTYIHTCHTLLTRTHTHTRTTHTCRHKCVHAHMHACIHTYGLIQACMHANIRPYIHAYIPLYAQHWLNSHPLRVNVAASILPQHRRMIARSTLGSKDGHGARILSLSHWL